MIKLASKVYLNVSQILKMQNNTKFAPREIFEQILEWSVMPTFDLLIELEGNGIVLVKRKISPYKNQWALPGLRMFKGETINDTIRRIAKQELGINIDPLQKKLLAQYVGKFTTENNRQDLSTAYHIKVSNQKNISINKEHFSSMKIINKRKDIPSKIGAMYKSYLHKIMEGEIFI